MKTAVRYFSRSGNTKKLAEAIGATLGVDAHSTDTACDGPVDLLFVGGSIYAGNIDGTLRTFLEKLTSNDVRKVAVFGTAGGPKSALPKIKELLAPKGIHVADDCFQCRGKFLLVNRGHPNDEDLKNAAAFARKVANS